MAAPATDELTGKVVLLDDEPALTAEARRRKIWGRITVDLLNSNKDIGRTPDSVKSLHQALVDAGVVISKQAVYRWASGDSAPTLDNQLVVCRIFGLPHHVVYPVNPS